MASLAASMLLTSTFLLTDFIILSKICDMLRTAWSCKKGATKQSRINATTEFDW